MPDFVCWISEGGNRERLIYADRGYIAYGNRKIVVGTVVASDDRIPLCWRAVVPRFGFSVQSTSHAECGETTEGRGARGGQEGAQPYIAAAGTLAIHSISREAECIPCVARAVPPPENWVKFASPPTPKVSKVHPSSGDFIPFRPRGRGGVACPPDRGMNRTGRRSPRGSAWHSLDQITRADPLSGIIALLRSLLMGGMLFLAGAGPAALLPLPPTPPVEGPPGHTAPIPDPFASRPVISPPSPQPSFGPAWLSSRRTQQSQGFIPGSQVEARPDRRTELAPGISLQLPLH